MASCVRGCNKTVVVMSIIANSCVGQAVIVTLVKCEQWHKSIETEVTETETKHVFAFT